VPAAEECDCLPGAASDGDGDGYGDSDGDSDGGGEGMILAPGA
jgi:hypothetical protein